MKRSTMFGMGVPSDREQPQQEIARIGARNGSCPWCCGVRRVTERVRRAMAEAATRKR